MNKHLRILAPVGISLSAIAVLVLLSSCGDGSGGTGPDPVPAETLASFDLTVPDSITEGEAFSLTVTAVGNRGANPLTSFSGSVSLTTTVGTVTPTSLTVSAGTGTAQVTLSDPGQQTLAASGGGRTGSVGLQVADLPDPTILGDPAAALEEAVPDSLYLPEPDDYSNNHPDLSGIYLSYNVVLLAFNLGTTVQQANELLMPLGGELVGAVSGVSGSVPGVLIVRLAATTHAELEAALASLRASPIVLHAIQDAVLSGNAVPRYSGWTTPLWVWEGGAPTGGNWGLELIRIPQMWNLNQAVVKRTPIIWTGVVDTGFEVVHDELKRRPQENFNLGVEDDHGTHVAGIIGADFTDGQGLEGVNPFAGFVFAAPSFPGSSGVVGNRLSWGATLVSTITLVADSVDKTSIINMSLGYNWSEAGIDANTSAQAQTLASTQGALLKLALDGLSTRRPLPVITASAGDDSGAGSGLQPARWASPMANAALDQGALNILVVESVDSDADAEGSATRSPTSNLGGHLSAPGERILSSVTGNAYTLASGTSMATAHVAGLAGYMFAVDPSLTVPQVRTALLNSSVPVGGAASNRIDAWAAAMEIDRVRGGTRVLEMMADLDDGTVDGNQRVDYDTLTFPDLDLLDVDGDGGLGDGVVDMSDFRVWRDWYLKIRESLTVQFDGRDDHPKFDVNDNGVTEDDAGEALHPRGDFNGDGLISLEDSARVFGAVQDSLNDLDVLKVVFNDPDYGKEELDTLVFSSDITVDGSIAFGRGASSPIRAEIFKKGEGQPTKAFLLTDAEPRKVFTVKSSSAGYFVIVRVGGPSSAHIADSSYKLLGKTPGTDAVMFPIQSLGVDVRSTFLNSCEDPDAKTAQPISLQTLGVEPGDFLFLDGAGTWPPVTELAAVFSASPQIKVETEQIPGDPPKTLVKRTITDAIALGANLLGGSGINSPATKECGGIPTDIPQDFTPFQVSFVRVPDGATHLFIGMASDYYSDKSQYPDPIRVEISKWYAPEWHNMYQPIGPGRSGPTSPGGSGIPTASREKRGG
jgi:hypothetical protein